MCDIESQDEQTNQKYKIAYKFYLYQQVMSSPVGEHINYSFRYPKYAKKTIDILNALECEIQNIPGLKIIDTNQDNNLINNSHSEFGFLSAFDSLYRIQYMVECDGKLIHPQENLDIMVQFHLHNLPIPWC